MARYETRGRLQIYERATTGIELAKAAIAYRIKSYAKLLQRYASNVQFYAKICKKRYFMQSYANLCNDVKIEWPICISLNRIGGSDRVCRVLLSQQTDRPSGLAYSLPAEAQHKGTNQEEKSGPELLPGRAGLFGLHVMD